MAGPVPAIHDFVSGCKDVDVRDKRAHDGGVEWVEHCETHILEVEVVSAALNLPSNHTGRLSCLRGGSSTVLPRSIARARTMRGRVACGMITSSI